MSTLKQDTKSRRIITVVAATRQLDEYEVAMSIRDITTRNNGRVFHLALADLAAYWPGASIKIDSGRGVVQVTTEGQIGEFGWVTVQTLTYLGLGLVDYVGETDWDIDLV